METYGPRDIEPSVMPVEAEFYGKARLALEALDPKLRIPLVLKEVEDMSVEEIARSMGITQTNVKVRLFRARKKLASILGNSAAETLKQRAGSKDRIDAE